MEKEKFSSFRLSPSKFVSMKNWDRKTYQRNALTAFLGGWIASTYGGVLIIQVIGDVLIVAGIVLEIIWIYKTIKEKIQKRSISVNDPETFKSKFKIKRISNKTWLIVILALILAFIFYWVFIRPVLTRQGCYKASIEAFNDPKYESGSNYLSADDRLRLKDYIYNDCKRKKGL